MKTNEEIRECIDRYVRNNNHYTTAGLAIELGMTYSELMVNASMNRDIKIALNWVLDECFVKSQSNLNTINHIFRILKVKDKL